MMFFKKNKGENHDVTSWYESYVVSELNTEASVHIHSVDWLYLNSLDS